MVWIQQRTRERQVPARVKLARVYVFGPFINAPPSHPDTVLTSMLYITKSLGEMGMTCGNLSIDMQQYMVGQQVKWFELEFKEFHPSS